MFRYVSTAEGTMPLGLDIAWQRKIALILFERNRHGCLDPPLGREAVVNNNVIPIPWCWKNQFPSPLDARSYYRDSPNPIGLDILRTSHRRWLPHRFDKVHGMRWLECILIMKGLFYQHTHKRRPIVDRWAKMYDLFVRSIPGATLTYMV